MEAMTNEDLCVLAQRGSEDAVNVLLYRNEMFLVQIAGELHRTLFTHSHDFSVDMKDLLQVARLAFWKAIETFDPSRGAKLTTYARTVIWNKILDFKEHYDVETALSRRLFPGWKGNRRMKKTFPARKTTSVSTCAGKEASTFDRPKLC